MFPFGPFTLRPNLAASFDKLHSFVAISVPLGCGRLKVAEPGHSHGSSEIPCMVKIGLLIWITIWLFNIAMENHHF